MSEGNGLPVGWAITTLGDLGEYLNGRAFSKDEWSTRGRPIIRIQDLTGTGKAPNYYEGELEERYVVRPGDLLISWAATLGAFIWRGSEGCLNQHIFKVVSHVDKLFHYYLTTAILEDLYRQAHGSGMVHITKGKFETTSTSLPPLPEQRRIVAAIEEQFARLDAGVAALQRARTNLKRYRASVLKAAVEGRLTEEWRRENPDAESGTALLERILEERRTKWEEAQLAKYAAKEQNPPKNWRTKYKEPAAPDTTDLPQLPGGWSWATGSQLTDRVVDGTHHTPTYVEEGTAFISVKDIRDGKIYFNDCKYISHEEHQRLKQRCNPEPGDLLITKSGTIGRTAVVNTDREFSLFVSVALLKPASSALEPRFFRITLDSYIQSINIQQDVKGGLIKNLHLEDLRIVPLRLASTREQEEIVAEVERRLSVIEEVEAQVEAGLKRASRLRQSILKRAFKGKLVPQDPTDEPASVLLERIREEREQAAARKPKRTARKNPKGEQGSLFEDRKDGV